MAGRGENLFDETCLLEQLAQRRSESYRFAKVKQDQVGDGLREQILDS